MEQQNRLESTELIVELAGQLLRKADSIPQLVLDSDIMGDIPGPESNEKAFISPIDDDLQRIYLLSKYSLRSSEVSRALKQSADTEDYAVISYMLNMLFWVLARERYDLHKRKSPFGVRSCLDGLCLVDVDQQAKQEEMFFQMMDAYEKWRRKRGVKDPESDDDPTIQ